MLMRSGSKLFGQDIVQKICNPEYVGIVMRCWHDEDAIPPDMPVVDPLMRPLKHGEVGITFLSPNGAREIIHENELRLLDRALRVGDYCKRSFEDLQSGVVTNVKVKARVHHAISQEDVPGWYTNEDLKDKTEGEIGDYVAYDDWIGQIVEVFDEYIVQLSSGKLVRLPELGSRLTVGERGPHVLPPPDVFQHFLYQNSTVQDGGENNTVLYVKHNTYAVAWLALNQSLDPAEYEYKPRPQRFWYGEDLAKLTLILGPSDLEMRLGDRVELKNAAGLPSTQHGQETGPTGVLYVQIFRVQATETTVDIIWQDSSCETLKSSEVIPYLNPDEYDSWPGDHVIFKDEGEERPAIVQYVNAVDRTASLLFSDTGSIELVSLLQLDTQGNPDQEENGSGGEGVGVQLGDFVFIHKPGETNGSTGSRVPRIGEIEPWIRDQAFDDEDLVGWRKAMSDIGSSIAAQRGATGSVEKALQRPTAGSGLLSWCGEVTALNLDGTVRVTHPDLSVAFYPLNRLTRLYGMEQLENDVWEAEDEGDEAEDESMWTTTVNDGGNWLLAENGGDWEDIPDEEMKDLDNSDAHPYVSSDDINMDADPGAESRNQTDIPRDRDANDMLPTICPKQEGYSDDDIWSPFKILPSAPADHAFFSSTPSQPSRSFLARLRKEYRVLDSSLPESILVRAYEDRTDLLRSLIVGPENTPYADAPFLIDWMLDSDFPNSPPKAHFFSWTNGNGRVNPNLYEEGKVCLSLLGTWQGDKHEVWHAQRSSILQAVVSVQGLVLVKEPWFCEPAYEKLRGTPDATVNSRLYTEKAYVLSRGFVSRALGTPVGSLQAEINFLYYKQGRLEKVVNDAKALIEKSRNSREASDDEWEKHAMPRLTAGGVIMLERILKKLTIAQSSPKMQLSPMQT